METKSISHIAELGANSGEIYIKTSAFNNEDDRFDIIRETAYNRTITNNFKNIKHLIEHKHSFDGIIGLPKEFETRADGLWVLTQINMNIKAGEEAYNQYKFFAENNMNIEHSVGYDTIQYKAIPEQKAKAKEKFGIYYPMIESKCGRELIELKLHEYSSVFKASNSQANQFYIKSGFDLDEFVSLALTDENITAQKIEEFKAALLKHSEGTQAIDPPTDSPIIPSVNRQEFATILINTISNTKLF
jgi:hypothetical protein